MSGDEHESRSEDRYDVGVAAAIQSVDAAEEAVRVTNLSASGCRFSLGRRLALGTPVSIKAGRAEPIGGEVKWQLDGIHGVQFDQPLAGPVLDHIRLFLSEQAALVSELRPESPGA